MEKLVNRFKYNYVGQNIYYKSETIQHQGIYLIRHYFKLI